MPWRFGRNHRHVDIGGRLNFIEMYVEAVREHERLALGHVRRDIGAIGIALHVIRHQDHDHVRCLRGVRNAHDL